MNLNSRTRNNIPGSGSDEVEQMLREAEDEMLLKLSTNSHLAHLSTNLPSDLEHRYQGLKSGSKKLNKSTLKVNPPSVSSSASTITRDQPPPVVSGNIDDDLFARFAALKATLPKPSSSADFSSSSVNPAFKPEDVQISKVSGDGNAAIAESSSYDENEDEVDKLIKWAIDAARLDPSAPSDDDDENEDKDSEDDISESSDEDNDKRKKGKRRTGK